MELVNFGSLNLDHVYTVSQFVSLGKPVLLSIIRSTAAERGSTNPLLQQERAQRYVMLEFWGVEERCCGKCWNKTVWTSPCCAKAMHRKGHAIIQVNSQGENCILLFGGSNRAVTREMSIVFWQRCINRHISYCKTKSPSWNIL